MRLRERLWAATFVELPAGIEGLIHGLLAALDRRCYFRDGQLQLLLQLEAYYPSFPLVRTHGQQGQNPYVGPRQKNITCKRAPRESL